MNKRNQVIRRVLAAVMALVLFLPLMDSTLVTEASAATKAEIDALKSQASSLNSQKKEIQEQLKAVRADKSKALEKKDLLESQIDVIEQEITNIQSQIGKFNNLISEKQVELEENEVERKKQYDLFCERIRVMEEEGETSYWSILFNSTSFSELLDNFMVVEEIIEYDNGIMDRLLAIQEKIKSDKAELEQARSEQQAAEKAQEAAKQELAEQETEVNQVIGEIREQEALLEKAEAALRQQAASVDAEIKKKEQAMKPQINNVVSESGYLWPLPANYNVLTSLFAGRRHPITGVYHNHTGIDVPAPGGTSIYAAKSGVVITSVKRGSYGNYVVISHSDGTSTLYAHMSSRAVKEGQTVKQGQVIGYVGTTGSSTGNHLHFEVRVNGVRTNPTNYYKSKTLYMYSGSQKVVLPH